LLGVGHISAQRYYHKGRGQLVFPFDTENSGKKWAEIKETWTQPGVPFEGDLVLEDFGLRETNTWRGSGNFPCVLQGKGCDINDVSLDDLQSEVRRLEGAEWLGHFELRLSDVEEKYGSRYIISCDTRECRQWFFNENKGLLKFNETGAQITTFYEKDKPQPPQVRISNLPACTEPGGVRKKIIDVTGIDIEFCSPPPSEKHSTTFLFATMFSLEDAERLIAKSGTVKLRGRALEFKAPVSLAFRGSNEEREERKRAQEDRQQRMRRVQEERKKQQEEEDRRLLSL